MPSLLGIHVSERAQDAPQDKQRAARILSCVPLAGADQRSERNALRISAVKTSGSSQAAKCPPLGASL